MDECKPLVDGGKKLEAYGKGAAKGDAEVGTHGLCSPRHRVPFDS